MDYSRPLRLIFLALCVLIGQGFIIAVTLAWIAGQAPR